MIQELRITLFVGLFVFAANSALAQAGGEVLEVKITHVVSSISAPTPPDQVEQLRLRVVDEHGHELRVLFGACSILQIFHPEVECLTQLESDALNHWLAGGEERRLLLMDHYISMFQRLDEDVARGKIVSTNARN
jgi:hypothetical protein